MQARVCVSGRTDSHVLATWLARAREAGGVEDTYLGKRLHPRTTWCAPVTVRELKPDGGVQYAYVCDISYGGLGLRCRGPVEVFSRISVTLDETGEVLCGQVRHCTETVCGYVVGISFELDVESHEEASGELQLSA